MFCKNCGTELSDRAVACPKCGEPMSVPAPAAAATAPEKEEHIVVNVTQSNNSIMPGAVPGEVIDPMLAYKEPPNIAIAYVLWFFLGSFGVHRFYLGSPGIGGGQLALTLSGLFLCGIPNLACLIWLIVDACLIPSVCQARTQMIYAARAKLNNNNNTKTQA